MRVVASGQLVHELTGGRRVRGRLQRKSTETPRALAEAVRLATDMLARRPPDGWCRSTRPDPLGAADESLWRRVAHPTELLRHVRGYGGVAPPGGRSGRGWRLAGRGGSTPVRAVRRMSSWRRTSA